MIHFAVPLRSRIVSSDWDRVGLCFNRCLKSIFNQTSDDFTVTVAAHELPPLSGSFDERLSTIEVDFQPPRTHAEQMRDKGRKIHLIASRIRAAGGGHIMKVDADDLVSRRLGDLAARNPDHNGWIFDQGFEHPFGSNRLRRCPGFSRVCGTSSIVNYSPDELPLGEADIDDPEIGERYPIRAPHHEILERRRAVGKPLAVLPFPGAVYVVETNDNWTASAGRVSRKRRLLRMAAPSKRLSPELRREFSMEWTTAADPQSSPTT